MDSDSFTQMTIQPPAKPLYQIAEQLCESVIEHLACPIEMIILGTISNLIIETHKLCFKQFVEHANSIKYIRGFWRYKIAGLKYNIIGSLYYIPVIFWNGSHVDMSQRYVSANM